MNASFARQATELDAQAHAALEAQTAPPAPRPPSLRLTSPLSHPVRPASPTPAYRAPLGEAPHGENLGTGFHDRPFIGLRWSGRQLSPIEQGSPRKPRTDDAGRSDVRLTVLHRPLGGTGGDTYDLSLLDADHLAVSLSDSAGHGIKAALFGARIKEALHKFGHQGDVEDAGPPSWVLTQLNTRMVYGMWSQCPFVAALHGILDRRRGVLSFARGGMPYPVLVGPGCEARQLMSSGGLVGVFATQTFENVDIHLTAGQSVIFFSDGLEALLLDRMGRHPHDDISETQWFRTLAPESMADHFAELAALIDDANPRAWPTDDICVVAVTME